MLGRLLALGLLTTCCGALAATVEARDDSGRWQLKAESESVLLIDKGVRVKAFSAARRDGREASAVTAIRYLPARRSFIVAFATLAELWELSLDPQAAPIYAGLVHDYRMGEGVAEPGYLGLRRTPLETPLAELAADDSGAYVVGRVAQTPPGRTELHLVQLDVRRTIGRFTVDGEPDLAGARTQHDVAGLRLSVPDRHGGAATLIDLRRARLLPHDAAAAPSR